MVGVAVDRSGQMVLFQIHLPAVVPGDDHTVPPVGQIVADQHFRLFRRQFLHKSVEPIAVIGQVVGQRRFSVVDRRGDENDAAAFERIPERPEIILIVAAIGLRRHQVVVADGVFVVVVVVVGGGVWTRWE